MSTAQLLTYAVICEPFDLDRSQQAALVDVIADTIAEQLIRERQTTDLEQEASA
jgi:hypothetical protein